MADRQTNDVIIFERWTCHGGCAYQFQQDAKALGRSCQGCPSSTKLHARVLGTCRDVSFFQDGFGSFVREARIRLQITCLGRGMQLDAVIIGAMMAGLEDWRLGLGDSAESILEDKSSEMCLADLMERYMHKDRNVNLL